MIFSQCPTVPSAQSHERYLRSRGLRVQQADSSRPALAAIMIPKLGGPSHVPSRRDSQKPGPCIQVLVIFLHAVMIEFTRLPLIGGAMEVSPGAFGLDCGKEVAPH